MKQNTGESFHSTDHWLAPDAVEVAAIGDLVCKPRTIVSREALEKVVFFYLLDGKAQVSLSDVGTVTLGADDILVVFPGRVLTVELTGRTNRLMSIALVGCGAVRAALGLGYWDLMRASERYAGNYMAEIIDMFHAAPKRGRDARVLSMVEHLLSTVWSRVRYSSECRELFDARRALNREICSARCLTTEEAAGFLDVSRSKLNALFVGGMGIRPGEYISQVITELAEAALFYSNDSVAKIAKSFSFSSSSAFAAFFRRRLGKTPAAFRRHPIPIG